VIQRLINSKNFVAFVLTAITGMALYFYIPFPEQNVFLQLMAFRAPLVFEGVKWSYTLFLFTTPYIVLSILLSGLYIFALKAHRKITAGRLPRYPDPRQRQDVFLVVGEVHNPRRPVPSETPRWLTISQRGLFTGIAIVGAVGTGKTSCCMYPFVEQLVAYKAQDGDKKIGGLILEVKGDFCHQVKEILTRHGRAEDYIEISLDSEYRYNPLHNDLDAYALAYSIASLLNNLFGKGKEPFWQQAYTNLVKFIILLHKITYDYVTLFDVYQCAISPDKRRRQSTRQSKKSALGVTSSFHPKHTSLTSASSRHFSSPWAWPTLACIAPMTPNISAFSFTTKGSNSRPLRSLLPTIPIRISGNSLRQSNGGFMTIGAGSSQSSELRLSKASPFSCRFLMTIPA
jgi:hypothetical protein